MTTPHSKVLLSPLPPSTHIDTPFPSLPCPTMYTRHKKKYPMKRNDKFVTTYARNTLHEKTELLQEGQIWLGILSIPLCKLL